MWPATRSILIVLAVVVACLFIVNGALLTIRPDLFLRFYDWQNPGDYWGKTAGWRKDVYSIQYKFLGIAFVAVGLFLLGFLIKLVLASSAESVGSFWLW